METRLRQGSRRLQANSERWSQTDPKHAVTLQFLDTEGYAFDQTENGEWNLFHEGSYYHSQQGAQEEADRWFAEQELDECTLLYVYGVGLGYLYKAAKSWLKGDRKRHLVFLEDDLQVISMLFQTPLGAELLRDKQVQLHYIRSAHESAYTFEFLFWNFLNCSFNVSALPFYAETRAKSFEEVTHKLVHDAAIKSAILDEYLKYGIAFFRNFYPNMFSLPGSYHGNGLFGKFEKVPAIICGAGPSLAKQLDTLRQLDNRALLFAGGSALNALNNAGIMPHFGAGVDPNPPQYDRYMSNTSFEVPFFYRGRLFHQALEVIHGPRLYLNGCGGYDVPRFFEERLGIMGEELEEGHNVVNFMVGLAHAMGCDPIILVGVDMGFTDQRLYAPGVTEEGAVSIESMQQAEKYDDRPLLREDINGKPLYTLWKWIAESDYIGQYAKDHPELTVINATEGGLGFPGVPNQPLSGVVRRLLNSSWDLRSWVHSEIQQCALPQADGPAITTLMQELKGSLERSRAHLKALREEGKRARKQIRSEGAMVGPLESGNAVLHEVDLGEEVGFQYVLHNFNEAYNWVLQQQFDQLKKARSEKSRQLKTLQIQDRKYKFLLDVIKANILVIDWALKEEAEERLPTHGDHSELAGPPKLSDKVSVSDKAGRRLAESQFAGEKRSGETRLWYGCGVLYAIERYREGVRDGKQEYYYEDGTPKSMMTYSNGHLAGVTTLYHPDGTVKRMIPASCE